MRQSFSNEDLNVLFKLIASQLAACGYENISRKLFKDEDLPRPSNWLIHLVMVGRDVLGITGFNFTDSPVTPYTSFVNSLQPIYHSEMVYDEATSSGTHTNVISPQKNYVAQSKNDYFTDEGKKSSETDDVRDQKALNKDDDVYNEPLAIINIDNPNRGKRKRVTKVGIMTNKSSESLQNEIKNLNSKLNHLVTVIDGEINQLATVESGSPTDDSSQLLVETTSKIGDSGTEIQAGLVIEELEPITTDKRRQKKRAPRRKEKSKGKLKDPIKSDFSSDADPSLAGETEMLSDLQRVLTSNIMSSTSLNKPRSKRGKYSPPWCGDEERPLVGNPVTVSDNSDLTINTKLLTELQRLLTQNNIRTVLNEEKKQIERRKSRPSLDSPPYIRPPHDTSSQDGTKFNLDMKKFPCSQCNKEFKTKQCLKRHIGRHLGVKPYACSFCKKRFNDKTNLGRHERVHMNIRKHVCDVCPQAFFRKEEMEKHKRIKHTIPDDIMKCKFKDCDYVCNLPSKLVEHIQTVHFGNYRYNCDKCNFRTQNITNYNNHLRVHSNERPFKCPKCGKGFKQWNGLEAHKKIHLKKDHICEICLKTFNLESSLKSHYDRNHGPRAALKKLKEKRKREILQKYRERRKYHVKNLSFVVSNKV